jgi:hypothetical protein
MSDVAMLQEALAQAEARCQALEQRLAMFQTPTSGAPPGLIIVLGDVLARWHAFEHSFRLLMTCLPPGSSYKPVIGSWLAAGINDAMRESLRPEHAWVSIYANDHVFPPDILYRLLARNVDVVAPVVCLRGYPFCYSMFHEHEGHFRSFGFTELAGQSGLVPVDAMGGPLVVIRRHVIDTIGQPFFEGEAGENPREDLVTFRKLKQAGYQPYIDLDVPIRHCGAGSIMPVRDAEGRWGVEFEFQGKVIGTIYPQVQEPETVLPSGYHAGV